MNSNKAEPQPAPLKDLVVPRDRDLDTVESSRSDVMPSPDTVNMPDEDYPRTYKSLPAESEISRKQHEQQPEGHDQLEVGSGGDAARPMRTGIMNPDLPPRGQMK